MLSYARRLGLPGRLLIPGMVNCPHNEAVRAFDSRLVYIVHSVLAVSDILSCTKEHLQALHIPMAAQLFVNRHSYSV
jgi:hypothetical protein